MRKFFAPMLLAACVTTSACAQKRAVDVAVTFSVERAQVAQTGTPSFWLKGGSVEPSFTFFHGLGIAANLTGAHKSDVTPGVDLGKFSFMAGPRYTIGLAPRSHARIFTEALFGVAHGFDSIFPTSSGALQSSATSSSMQFGGGFDVTLKHGFGIRPIEVDYVHTTLPNNSLNSQNDLRLAFGVVYRKASH